MHTRCPVFIFIGQPRHVAQRGRTPSKQQLEEMHLLFDSAALIVAR